MNSRPRKSIYRIITVWTVGGSLFILFWIGICGGILWLLKPKPGEVIETWEIESCKFKIRVTAFGESGPFGTGAYYRFEGVPMGAEFWKEVMTFREDGPAPIPRQQVRFVKDDTAYLFMGWMYAVTADAGETWSVWDCPHRNWCNYGLIQDVIINEDGSGIMTLNELAQSRGAPAKLYTSDFGRTWGPQTEPAPQP